MAICSKCRQETSDPSILTCQENTGVVFPDGTVQPPVPYDPRRLHLPQWYRCPDCNIVPGGLHHSNCDQEHCPKCDGQLLSCSCFE